MKQFNLNDHVTLNYNKDLTGIVQGIKDNGRIILVKLDKDSETHHILSENLTKIEQVFDINRLKERAFKIENLGRNCIDYDNDEGEIEFFTKVIV